MSEKASRRLFRSRVDKVLGGVCAGIAEYFNIDSTIVRLAFVAFFVINPIAAIIIYIAAWIIIPEKPLKGVLEEVKVEGKKRKRLILVGLLLILAGVIGAPRVLTVIRDITNALLIIVGILIVVIALLRRE
ncbi:MAG: hypothetical protein B6U75_02535 [Desulfurococcales archaeon ex4484_217_1]|nr:MAG: hypothetical protein B6U75_02535 [Desulfurococcales archaeon ex4484_217_1]